MIKAKAHHWCGYGPNSLGPGELLIHYGTNEQKVSICWLANGKYVLCFGLTGPNNGQMQQVK